MAYLTLTGVRAKVAEILATVPILAGESIVIDNGLSKDAIEDRFDSRGFVVIVGPILSLRNKVGTKPIIQAEAVFTVEFYSNPTRNPNGANVDIISAISASIRALTAFSAGTGEQPFSGEFDLCEMTVGDTGAIGYLVTFTKLVAIE